MHNSNPIGIFDSGVGGLSICHAIKALLPSEDIIYFADLGYAPYGNKPKPLLDQRSESIVHFFSERQCKAIVVACNTATVNSIHHLRSKFVMPIVGVEPGVKPAALSSKTGAVGVLATAQTLKSDSFHTLKARFAAQTKINVQACPEFVTLVEHLEHQSDKAITTAEKYIRPLLNQGCDQIVLGCTHFAFLRSAIDQVIAGQAAVIDTAMPVAKELQRRLQQTKLLNKSTLDGQITFWTSGIAADVETRINTLWGAPSVVHEAVL